MWSNRTLGRLVRKKSLMPLRNKIRIKTKRRGTIDSVIASLSPTLKSWYGDFKHAQRCTFSLVDGFVRTRLRALLHRHRSTGRIKDDARGRKQLPNAFFADLGLFTMYEIHQLADESQ